MVFSCLHTFLIIRKPVWVIDKRLRLNIFGQMA
jgi:hypothetical protein